MQVESCAVLVMQGKAPKPLFYMVALYSRLYGCVFVTFNYIYMYIFYSEERELWGYTPTQSVTFEVLKKYNL